MNTMDAILTRRSVRRYQEEGLKRSELEQIVRAAAWAPSGKNAQTWHFTMISNPEKIQRLAAAIRKADNRPESYNFYAPPAFLIISGEKDNYNASLDSGAAMQNALLVAWDMGISSCWINQVRACCDDPEVREILTEYGIPEDHDVWAAAGFGYAEERPEPHERAADSITFVE